MAEDGPLPIDEVAMPQFSCPFLDVSVDLTDERWQHIQERRPYLEPAHLVRILAAPDQVLASKAD